jgi:hypothetical protein
LLKVKSCPKFLLIIKAIESGSYHEIATLGVESDMKYIESHINLLQQQLTAVVNQGRELSTEKQKKVNLSVKHLV